MASSEDAGVSKLVGFGQMALEQGWHNQACEYFERALDLDPSNLEALQGLVRVNEVLSRVLPTPVEPAVVQPVVAPREIKRKYSLPEKKPEMQTGSSTQWFRGQPRPRKMIILTGVQILFLWLYAGLADIIPRTQKAMATPASIGKPMAVGTILIDPAGRQTWNELVETQRSGPGDKQTSEEMMEQQGPLLEVVRVIVTKLPNPTPVSEVERGWLCDRDGRGEVALWAKPAAADQEDNSIAAVVGMSVKGCVDGILLDETISGSVVFYQVRVGYDQGWAGVNYFYPTSDKPQWSQ